MLLSKSSEVLQSLHIDSISLCLHCVPEKRDYILYYLTLFIHKAISCLQLNLSFLCSVISQGKALALDR